MLFFPAALDAVPSSLVEAATVDGPAPFRRYFTIVLPLLSPSLFFAVTMTLITSFQVFIQPYILTGGGPGVSTETLVMYLYRTGFEQFAMGQAAAIAWFLFAIIMIVTAVQFIFQRRWGHYGRWCCSSSPPCSCGRCSPRQTRRRRCSAPRRSRWARGSPGRTSRTRGTSC